MNIAEMKNQVNAALYGKGFTAKDHDAVATELFRLFPMLDELKLHNIHIAHNWIELTFNLRINGNWSRIIYYLD